MNAKRDFILSNTHKLLVDHIVFSARVYLCLGNYSIVDSILCQSTELFVLCNHYMSMVSMDQFSNYIGLSFHSVVLLLVVVDFHTLIHTLWSRLACIWLRELSTLCHSQPNTIENIQKWKLSIVIRWMKSWLRTLTFVHGETTHLGAAHICFWHGLVLAVNGGCFMCWQ